MRACAEFISRPAGTDNDRMIFNHSIFYCKLKRGFSRIFKKFRDRTQNTAFSSRKRRPAGNLQRDAEGLRLLRLLHGQGFIDPPGDFPMGQRNLRRGRGRRQKAAHRLHMTLRRVCGVKPPQQHPDRPALHHLRRFAQGLHAPERLPGLRRVQKRLRLRVEVFVLRA